MTTFTIAVTCSFGIESVLVRELNRLGITENIAVENGRITFPGSAGDVVRCNLWLRCADRVYLEMARFGAVDFEELFQGTLAVPWEEIIPMDGTMHVVGKSVKSKLHSVPDCQAIVKKAVVESMKRKHRLTIFPEDGPLFRIEISMLKDTAIISMDTSGVGLHKRGYREEGGEAPLRETLAAALIYLSRWRPERILADPLCGSATIPIEAALMGCNIAPGINRSFAAQEWDFLGRDIWERERAAAREAVTDIPLTILASDNDQRVFKKARENARRAGVLEKITFQKKPVEEFSTRKKYGCVICNPPYGERLGSNDEVTALYKNMGTVLSQLDSWSLFILTGHEEFENHFGRKADKNRKLYNGKIKTYLYQYLGQLPPR
ncbi:MAG: RNA methyltransferase [Spirochaetae bacterium HGW-Spirochaetae-1]|jgi:putative N6-adenine-specific DNA methylase|nr:MAG: RNA methyltransferase [Spirochaetae bacterium HGW-Spirochaetae-1]